MRKRARRCHMPYTREGGLKISDQHVESPLLNINHACQTPRDYQRKASLYIDFVMSALAAE